MTASDKDLQSLIPIPIPIPIPVSEDRNTCRFVLIYNLEDGTEVIIDSRSQDNNRLNSKYLMSDVMNGMEAMEANHSKSRSAMKTRSRSLSQYLGKGFVKLEDRDNRMTTYLCDSKDCWFASDNWSTMRTHIRTGHSKTDYKKSKATTSGSGSVRPEDQNGIDLCEREQMAQKGPKEGMNEYNPNVEQHYRETRSSFGCRLCTRFKYKLKSNVKQHINSEHFGWKRGSHSQRDDTPEDPRLTSSEEEDIGNGCGICDITPDLQNQTISSFIDNRNETIESVVPNEEPNEEMEIDFEIIDEFLNENYLNCLDELSSDAQLTAKIESIAHNSSHGFENSSESEDNSDSNANPYEPIVGCSRMEESLNYTKQLGNVSKIVIERNEDLTNHIVISEESKCVNVFHCIVIDDKLKHLSEEEIRRLVDKRIEVEVSKPIPKWEEERLRCEGFDGCAQQFDTYEQMLRHNINHKCGRGLRELDDNESCSDLRLSKSYNRVFGSSDYAVIYECKRCAFVVKDVMAIRTHVHDSHHHPIKNLNHLLFANKLRIRTGKLIGNSLNPF